jgi:hypothetical protein
MSTQTFQIPPFSIEVDGVTCEILEATENKLIDGTTQYSIAVRIHYKDITTRTFTVTCKNTKDMTNKLKAEITKIKLMDYAYGTEYLKKVIT